jgi:zinc protease
MPRRSRFFWLAGVFVTLAPAVASAADVSASPLPLEEHRLANGMRVVLAPDSALGDVTVMVRYNAGDADDPPGKEGLAHVVEHLMFDGSKHVAAGEHVRLLEEAGGSRIDGSAGVDTTSFFETIPPGRLPLAFWLERDRMALARDRIDAGTVQREWQAADAEVDETHRTGSGNAGYEAIWGEIFPAGHPYHRVRSNRIGLGVFGETDVRAFLQSWYTPANATLVVAGHFEPAPTLALAERYFGALPAPPPPARAPVAADWKVPDVRLEVTASVAREIVSFAWRAPPIEHPDDLALDMAATILGAPKGRLERALVERGLASWAWSSEQSLKGGSIFHVNAAIVPGADPDAVIAAVERVVADLGASLTPAEVDVAHRVRRDARLGSLQTSAGRTAMLVTNDRFDLAKYDPIDAEAIMGTVRRLLVPSRRVVMVVHNVPKSPWYGVVVHREEHVQ